MHVQLFLPLPLVSVECPADDGELQLLVGVLHAPNEVVIPELPIGCAGGLTRATVLLPGRDGPQRLPATRAEACGVTAPQPIVVGVLWVAGAPAGAAEVEPFDLAALTAAVDRYPDDGWFMLQEVGLVPPRPAWLRPVERSAEPAVASSLPETPGVTWMSSGTQFSGWVCHLFRSCHPTPRF